MVKKGRAERVASAGARTAGSGIGAALSSPFGFGLLGVGAIILLLVLFQKQIGEFFAGLKFPEFPPINIELPKIEFPDFNFPEITFPEITFPEITFPDFSNLFQPQVEPERQDVPFPDPEREAAGLPPIDIVPDVTGGRADRLRDVIDPPRETIEEIFPDQPVSISDFINRFTQPQVLEQDVRSFLVDEPTQQFTGAGVSFEGGAIFETPIENLSLSQIADKFMVSASKAASLRARAQGFTPEEQAFLMQGDSALPEGIIAPDFGGFTGDPQFIGLTPEEIALRLTGGNISNF